MTYTIKSEINKRAKVAHYVFYRIKCAGSSDAYVGNILTLLKSNFLRFLRSIHFQIATINKNNIFDNDNTAKN